MGVETIGSVRDCLRAKRHAIIEGWLARTLQTYPEHTGQFLSQEKDPFRNPVGSTLKNALPVLFDGVLEGRDSAQITPALDSIVRIRAVQDFTASQAVAFLFLLKRVVREAMHRPPHPPLSPTVGGEEKGERVSVVEDLAALDGRIDEIALLAFDLFMKCRERIYEIKAKEARRRIYVLERMYGMEPSASACGPDLPLAPEP